MKEETVELEQEPLPEYLSLKEIARMFGLSRDTLRRYLRNGNLNAIEWVDFFGDGKLRARRESVESFIADRRAATKQIYARRLKKSRAKV